MKCCKTEVNIYLYRMGKEELMIILAYYFIIIFVFKMNVFLIFRYSSENFTQSKSINEFLFIRYLEIGATQSHCDCYARFIFCIGVLQRCVTCQGKSSFLYSYKVNYKENPKNYIYINALS